jgi:hypothetical protein
MISIKKRIIINKICNNFNLNNINETDICNFPINCNIIDCNYKHLIEMKHRINICKILESYNDLEAYILYDKLYVENKEKKIIEIINNIINILKKNNTYRLELNKLNNLKIIKEKIIKNNILKIYKIYKELNNN